MTTRHIILAALTGVSAIAFSSSSFAQVAQAGGPPQTTGDGNPASGQISGSTDRAAGPVSADASSGDIVVTAQRRSERVTDVPISITVANQAQLERQQINTVSDLSRIAPSLEINSGAATSLGGGGAIRGVGTQTFAAGAQASVGIVVDQVSQGNANISDIFDVARIEVLKGPQGTLFGLTTSAGVINITSNAPDPNRTTLRVRTELSNAGTAGSIYGQQVLQGVANLPIGPDAAIRVAGTMNHRQGVNRNATTNKMTDVGRYAIRARLFWEPSDTFTLNLIGDYTKANSDGVDFFTFIRNAPSRVIGQSDLQTLLSQCGITVREGNQDYCTELDITRMDENYGVSLQADYDLGPVTLTSISSARSSNSNQNAQSIYRADPLRTSITNVPQISDTSLFTQELRLSSRSNRRLEYTIGAFYSSGTNDQQARLSTNIQPGATVTAPSRTILNRRGLINIEDESFAGFGQATFHVTDALRLIAGARYTHAELSFVQTAQDGTTTDQATSVNNVSYRAGVQYDFDGRTMAYATVNRGFKSGQITVPSNATTPPQALRPEVPQSYDVGLKSTLFGGWVMDLNAFHTKVNDYQGQQSVINPTTGGFSTQQVNVPYILSRGAEINLFGRVTDNLTLNTGLIYAKTTYSPGLLGNDGSEVGGKQVAYSPRYKFTASGEYEHDLGALGRGFLAVDTVWKSRIRFQQSSVANEAFRPHWIVGGRVGFRDPSDRYSMGIFVRNLFNVHEPVTLQEPLTNAFPQATAAIYGQASYRQVGLSLDAKF